MTTTATVEQPTAVATRWTADPNESSVEFGVKTFWGLSTVRGHFDSFDGSYDAGSDGTAINLTIAADSLDTGNTTRDKHLRSTAFFHVAEHPRVRFISTRVHDVDGRTLHVVGHLEAAGKSVLLEFPATMRERGDALDIEATTTVDQQELGMSSGPARDDPPSRDTSRQGTSESAVTSVADAPRSSTAGGKTAPRSSP